MTTDKLKLRTKNYSLIVKDLAERVPNFISVKIIIN